MDATTEQAGNANSPDTPPSTRHQARLGTALTALSCPLLIFTLIVWALIR
jgi:hypothetical protein